VSRLPRGVSYRRVIKALKRAGFVEIRHKGSHIVLRRDDPFAQVVVPAHSAIDTGTLSSILDAAGIHPEEFRKLLR
jgi:predicted RNA binding protein YcfA (HicA-like mRNA interferase family)